MSDLEASVDALLDLDERGRAAWLDQRRPAGNEWLGLLWIVERRVAPDRPDVVALHLWLLGQAGTRAVFSADETALKLAYAVLTMRRAGVEEALLPRPDDIVRSCLDAMPVNRDAVATITDRRRLGDLGPDAMRLSRRARNLVRAARWHLEHVADPRLAAETHAWIAIEPHLV
ncbi:hypothetical protein [Asanoa siamensis]|uniref:Uncharacterized protein n=1 Tax=Asanoa siamensis TaxID=926357 RepID=A0ABQ4CJ21_9ACTN|nr:hypothetical protein [Asanoa siamensis]GIF71294.1 hypothetical protein Asi02nite_08120 [Asanoa siamensis]